MVTCPDGGRGGFKQKSVKQGDGGWLWEARRGPTERDVDCEEQECLARGTHL